VAGRAAPFARCTTTCSACANSLVGQAGSGTAAARTAALALNPHSSGALVQPAPSCLKRAGAGRRTGGLGGVRARRQGRAVEAAGGLRGNVASKDGNQHGGPGATQYLGAGWLNGARRIGAVPGGAHPGPGFTEPALQAGPGHGCFEGWGRRAGTTGREHFEIIVRRGSWTTSDGWPPGCFGLACTSDGDGLAAKGRCWSKVASAGRRSGVGRPTWPWLARKTTSCRDRWACPDSGGDGESAAALPRVDPGERRTVRRWIPAGVSRLGLGGQAESRRDHGRAGGDRATRRGGRSRLGSAEYQLGWKGHPGRARTWNAQKRAARRLHVGGKYGRPVDRYVC